MSNIKLIHGDCMDVMPTLESERIDVICIDPPYLYLKNQKLERAFDEDLFFSECKRLLTKNGFIVMFGRGESFYRWNTTLSGLGFKFKEEIIWDKLNCSSPLLSISRVHETISVWCKGKGSINKQKIEYLEIKKYNIQSIIDDIKKLKTTFSNAESLKAVQHFLETKKHINQKEKIHKHNVSAQVSGLVNSDRNASVIQAMENGLTEKSIIRLSRDHYGTIHPTQKPIRLIERLLALVVPKDKPISEVTVADFFGGSFSTMEAAHKMGLNGITCEIDEDYFKAGKKRFDLITSQQLMF